MGYEFYSFLLSNLIIALLILGGSEPRRILSFEIITPFINILIRSPMDFFIHFFEQGDVFGTMNIGFFDFDDHPAFSFQATFFGANFFENVGEQSIFQRFLVHKNSGLSVNMQTDGAIKKID